MNETIVKKNYILFIWYKIGRWASQRRPGSGNILPLRSYTSREKEIWSNIFVMHGNGYTSTIDRNVSTSAIMGMVTPLL